MSLLKKLFAGLVCSLLAVAAYGQTPVPAHVQTGSAAGAATASTSEANGANGTRVHGIVTDPDGDLIPGATIMLTPPHGSGHSVKSGSDGTYSIALAPGSYSVVVSMPGFASYAVKSLKIPAVTSTTLDFKLRIGQTNEVVNVEANAIQLSVDPDSNASATVLQGKDLEALSDDPDELESELQALAGPSAGPNGGQIYVDGFTGGQLPPKSSIREIRINQNPFSAEYDKLGYGRIEVFTKPGTDKLHGNFQIDGNNSSFNSGNPLATGYQPPYHTMFMFGNLTGPLTKSASYNFGGTYRQIQDDSFTNATILAPASDLKALCNPGDLTCVQTKYQVSTYYPQTRLDINPRLDLALGDKNVLTTRYQLVKNDSTNAGIGNLSLPSAAYNSTSLSNILQMSDTQTFSPRLINETRFEYEREHVATTALNNTPSISVSGNFNTGGAGSQNYTDHQDHYEVQNYTSLQLKKNFIRMGGRLRVNREAESTQNNTNGSFTYSSLTFAPTVPACVPSPDVPCAIDNSYQTGTPRQFAYTYVNNHKIGDTYADLGLYAETDWKAEKNLTISYGVRYETQSHLRDHHDIAPRLSFNYGLFSGKGAPKTVLRGGFGLFYERFGQSSIMTLQQENGLNETIYTVAHPGAGCAPTPGVALTTAVLNACLSGTTAASQTTYKAADNLRTPYIVQFAIGADQQVGRLGTISVNYLHSGGVHAMASQNVNYNVATQGPANAALGPQYQFFSEGSYNQNQLIANGRLQIAKWVSLFGYYSLNSAHGDTSGNFVTTPFNIKADYGRTTFSVHNRLFLAGSVTLPHYIQFSPFMVGQSGMPYNITTGNDNNNDSIFNDRPYLANDAVANGTTIKTIAGCGTFAQSGSQPAGAAIVPINYCNGSGLFTFNFRLTKTWGFGETKAAANTSAGSGPDSSSSGSHGSHSGSHSHGGSSHGGFHSGGVSTGKHYNFALGLHVDNLFGNKDLATPQGTLSSSQFGQSTQLTNGFYTTRSAVRRVRLQASFSF